MSMLLPPFELHEPRSIKEAVDLRAHYPDSDIIAGGTDLLPNYKWGLNTKKHVISLARVDEMRELTTTRIGALVTLTQIEKSGLLSSALPILPETARQIATPLLRNVATLGGNLMLENRCFFFNQTFLWRKSVDFCLKADGQQCHVVPQKEKCYATFSADLPAALMVLGATMDLVSAAGRRTLALRDVYNGTDGIHRLSKRPDEIVVGVDIPPETSRWKATYKKLRLRDSFDFPELGIAAAIRLDKGDLAGFRLVANALEHVPVVLDDLGASRMGAPLTEEAIIGIAKEAEARVRPVKNTNLPPSYRKAMTRVYVERALRELSAIA
ncbi:MAG TPA: FAD binding domain-containing protein [Candidatus Thermoplasmatota archaeon]|nr:FAD binding domain-containing protein [Candidatus Thermoplasmatota archaeon]